MMDARCETCGMQDGNHDRACWQQQLHEQRMRIVKKLAAWKKQYEAPMPGSIDINKLCVSVIDSAINIVRET